MYWLVYILLFVAFFAGFWTATLFGDSKSRERCYECYRLGDLNDLHSFEK